MKTFFPALLIVSVLSGCSSYLIQWQFDDSLEAYNQSLRWHEWNKASLYASESILKEFNARIVAEQDVRVVEYHIINKTYNAEKREATVEVEFDYYKVFSYTIKTLHDTQRWAYAEENGAKGWRLVSGLPEFR